MKMQDMAVLTLSHLALHPEKPTFDRILVVGKLIVGKVCRIVTHANTDIFVNFPTHIT